MTSRLVIVFGSSRVPPTDPEYARAYRLGRLLAEAGYAVGSGGYQGLMEAVSRGAREAGAHVIGYTCDIFPQVEPNPWLVEERRTPTLTERIERMAEEGDAFIALPGGIGTLAELTVIWNLLLVDYLGANPLLLLGEMWPPLLDAFRTYAHIGSSAFRLLRTVATEVEAVHVLRGILEGKP